MISRLIPTKSFWISFSLLFFALGRIAGGQSSATPALPEGRLLDDSHFFDEEQKQKVRASLHAIAENEKIEINLAVVSYVEDGTLQIFLEHLLSEWVPDGPGMVLGYERGSGQFSVATNHLLSEMIPYPTQRKILSEVFTADENHSEPSARLTEALGGLVDRFAQFRSTTDEARKLFSARNLILVAAVIPFLAGFLFLTRMLVLKEHAGEKKRNRTLLFPQVNVAPRLGGEFSGGVAGASVHVSQTENSPTEVTSSPPASGAAIS